MNHYETLGVSENVTPEELKTKWKELVKEHHPDKHGGDDTKMKEINAAYDTLKDPKKKAEYDQQRHYESFSRHNKQSPFGFERDLSGMDFDEVLRAMNDRPGWSAYRARGFRGPAFNQDTQISLQISLEEAFAGKSMDIQIPIDGIRKNINITIPAGAVDGVKIKYASLGSHLNKNAAPGDLIVLVRIVPEEGFKVDGSNLIKTIDLSAFDCILGTETIIETIDKKVLNLKVPKRTNNGSKLKIKGNGMPIPGSEKRGDLIIIVNMIMPELTKEQEEKLRELKDL